MTSVEGRTKRRPPLMGFVLLVLGFILLLNALNIFHLRDVISRFWPGIFVVAGIVRLSERRQDSVISGIFWIGIGALGLAARAGYVQINMFRMVVPILLIWFGLLILARPRWRTRQRWGGAGEDHRREDASEWIDANAILGGGNRVCTSTTFRGGEINCIMGGFKIDLRNADMAPGEASLEVNAIMGGVELTIPNGWLIINEVQPVLGGFEDYTNPPKDATKKLVIHGSVVMGGLTVRN